MLSLREIVSVIALAIVIAAIVPPIVRRAEVAIVSIDLFFNRGIP